MLDDRQYMRRAPGEPGEFHWSATTLLMVVTAAAFLLQTIIEHDRSYDLRGYWYLSREGMLKGYVWQLITFQFLHGNLMHLVFNLLSIYTVGRELENVLGKASFLKLYLGTGAAGGLLHFALAITLPRLGLLTEFFETPVVGASAGACGLLAAFSALYWNRSIPLVFFSIPMTVTGRGLLWLNIGGTLLLGVMLQENVAHAAHLGGTLAGLYYVFGILHGNPWGTWTSFRQPERRPRQLVRAAAAREAAWQQAKPVVEEDLPPSEYISKEVDPILEKISAHGINSLTEREKKILEKARSKISKK